MGGDPPLKGAFKMAKMYFVNERMRHNVNSMINLMRIKGQDFEACQLAELLSAVMASRNKAYGNEYGKLKNASMAYEEHRAVKNISPRVKII